MVTVAAGSEGSMMIAGVASVSGAGPPDPSWTAEVGELTAVADPAGLIGGAAGVDSDVSAHAVSMAALSATVAAQVVRCRKVRSMS
jgi:hypothetical protein